MDPFQRAVIIQRKAHREASGYLDLANLAEACGKDSRPMRDAAIQALQRLTENEGRIGSPGPLPSGWKWTSENTR
jgi:hypothetical protein